jgi:hypothetical protein
MSAQQRFWRRLLADRGSQSLEAAGAALAAAVLVIALLGGARSLLGPSVERAFECAAAAIGMGGGGCEGGAASGPTAPTANASQPQPEPEKKDCSFLCHVGGFFKGVGEGVVDTVKGIGTLAWDGIKAAAGDQETRDKYAGLVNAFREDPWGTTKAVAGAIVEPIVTDWKEGRYGEAIGRGVFEVVSTIGGPKGLDKLGKLGKVDDIARVAGKADDIARVGGKVDDIARVGGKADEISDAERVIDSLPCLTVAPMGKGPGLAKPLTMPCSRAEYDKLRKKTPSQAIRDKINEPDVKKDPVYGFDVTKFEADHIVPMNEIVDMPGFDKLTEAQKIEVLNLEDNFMGLSKRSNASKQDKTWTEWQGHKELGPIPPEVRREMIRREGEARRALQRAINDRLNPPPGPPVR